MKNFQKKISPILKEIHDTFWENDLKKYPNDWSDEDIASATKIFLKIIFESMFNRKISHDKNVGFKTGEEIHQFVLEKTGVDLKEFYK